MKDITITFSETAEQEINSLITELQLVPIAAAMQKNESLPEELKVHLGSMLSVLLDMFSNDLPDISGSTEETIRASSRDIHLASILRERGIFRFYRLISQTGDTGAPLYLELINPNSGSPFATQEEFVGWFCGDSHISRAILFQRISTIDRMQELGFSLADTFKLILAHPYAMQETIREIANWGRGASRSQILSVNPDVAVAAAKRVAPDNADAIEDLADRVRKNPDDMDAMADLVSAAKPILAQVMEEVSDLDRAKDAMDFVRYDILTRPEITYSWDPDTDILTVELLRREVGPTGSAYMTRPINVPFVPDVESLPREIRDDLMKRLPIKNRVDVL